MAGNEQVSMGAFWRLARSRARSGHLSAARQLVEALFLYFVHGVGPSYYQLAAFWDRDVSWKHKTSHLSTAAYRKTLAELNPINYRKLSQHKLAEKAMLTLLGVPTPTYLSYYRESAGRATGTQTLTSPGDLDRFIIGHPALDKICFKGVEGWAGKSFEITEIQRSDDGLKLLRARTQDVLTVSRFCSDVLERGQHAGGSVMEECVVQHTEVAALNPSSLNTMRLWVLQVEYEEVRVLLGYMRIGRQGSIVDNQSSGGIVAPIDLDTGVLNSAIDGTPNRQIFDVHPDHGAAVRGFQIPLFEEALALAKRTLIEFPGIRFAGIDVAIASDGPKIIELNASPDREGAAFTKVPSKQLF